MIYLIIIIAIFIMVMFPVVMVFTGKLQLLRLSTEREEAFIREYILDSSDARAAAIRAGAAAAGAKVWACRTLKDRRVQAAIQAFRDRLEARREAAMDRAESAAAERWWAEQRAEEERRIARQLARDDPYSTFGT